jgi:HK97 family phage prohead protease
MLLTRDYDLRDAQVGGDGRTLVLACVPFDAPAWVDDGNGPYREAFQRGAFAHVVKAPNRVELRYRHRQAGVPYGFGVDLVEDEKYLLGSFRVAPGDQGDQLLALVADGQMRGVSIGFVAGSDRTITDADGPIVSRVRVKQLGEVSVLPTGTATWTEAEVLAVREAPDHALVAARERERLRLLRTRLHLS